MKIFKLFSLFFCSLRLHVRRKETSRLVSGLTPGCRLVSSFTPTCSRYQFRSNNYSPVCFGQSKDKSRPSIFSASQWNSRNVTNKSLLCCLGNLARKNTLKHFDKSLMLIIYHQNTRLKLFINTYLILHLENNFY